MHPKRDGNGGTDVIGARTMAAVVLSAFLAGGCERLKKWTARPASGGEGKTPTEVAKPAPAARKAPEPGPTSEQTRPSGKKPLAGKSEPAPPYELDRVLKEILTLEEDTKFSEALKLCRETRRIFRAHPRRRELDAVMQRLNRKRRVIFERDLPFAIKSLGSDRDEEVEIAKDKLVEAGEVAGVFLLKALHDETGRLAAEAARVLVELRDERAPRAFVDKLQMKPKEPLRSALRDGLRELAGKPDGELLREILPLVARDEDFSWRDLAGYLCAVLETACDGDAAKFNKLLGDADAHGKIRRYVKSAMDSRDEAAAGWATAYAALVGVLVDGMRGSYYHGINFEKLVHEQLDSRIDVPNRSFPYPDGRQDNISVRWTGRIRVKTPGRYTFYSASDDGQRLWVNGTQLIDDWNIHGVLERRGAIELGPGLHLLKVEFMQVGGDAVIKVSWEGPGIEKQVITDENLYTTPWKGMRQRKPDDALTF